MNLLKGYIALTKPRILVMVLVTTTMGYFLGGNGIQSWSTLFWLLLGSAATCGGAAALNHYIERDIDARMDRTKNRPIPSGLIPPINAMLFGTTLSIVGTIILVYRVNLLCGFLALLTVFLYIFLYTPMKRVSWVNTVIGAIPGALPPMGGWVAATGSIDPGAWVLFGILFLWQHPHFFAIAWMYKEDYEQGGFKMLPGEDDSGDKTFFAVISTSIALLIVSVLPSLMGLSGMIYLIGAVALGFYILHYGVKFANTGSKYAARKLLHSTLLYLPGLLVLFIGDGQF